MKWTSPTTLILVALAGLPGNGIAKNPPPLPRAEELVIYEIATKSFTSPNGPGSGTFDSLRKRIPYLADLGINAVWLSGHSRSDPSHFYNIRTQYACIEPDRFDPSMGTPDDFRKMVDDFHRHGIRVFLDVITHGVLKGSPMIERHPDWFQGNGTKGSWGMIDYQWNDAPEPLEAWWVKLWTDMALKYGVDGFRLDTNAKRPDLWRKIQAKCADRGVEIIIFNESLFEKGYGDVIRFAQGFRYFDIQTGFDPERARKAPENLLAQGEAERKAKTPGAESFLRAVELSCHDAGWEGFPANKNPYVVQGRRWVFGYAGVLLPSIVVMMSGEEFDCDFRPLPRLASGLYGAENVGKGRWLYGSWIDWDQLNRDEKRAMFEDARRLLAIRREYADLIHSVPIGETPRLKPLSVAWIGDASEKMPTPYLLWNDRRALLVAGNPSTNRDAVAEANLESILSELWPKVDRFELQDVRTPNSAPTEKRREAFGHLRIRIGKDGISGGGVAILRIRPLKQVD